MNLLERIGSPMRDGRAALLAATVAFAVFAGTLWHGFVYDDAGQILSNAWVWDARYLPDLLTSSVHSYLDQRPGNYYRPIQMLIYFIDAHLFGRHAFGFHLTNILVHATTTAVAYLLLRRITGARRARFAALLFAVHPAHVESVAWISGSTDVNCALLVFLCLLLWSKTIDGDAGGWKITGLLAMVWGLFLLSLLAKEIAAVTPILALTIPAAFRVRPSGTGTGSGAGTATIPTSRWRWAAVAVPLFGSGIALYALIRFNVLGTLKPFIARPALSGAELLASGLALIPRYLSVGLFPWRLVPDRVVPHVASLFDPFAILGMAILAAAAAVVYRLRRRAPVVAWGIALTILPLLPVLKIDVFPYDIQPDRYLYVPSLGICLLLAEGCARLWRRFDSPTARKAIAYGCAVVLAAGALRTVTAAAIWSDNETLGRAGIIMEPRSVSMHILLIAALDQAGRAEEAYRVAERALGIAPGDRVLQAAVGGLRARLDAGSPDEAIRLYHQALAANPHRSHLWASLAAVYFEAGRPQEAIEAAERSLDLDQFNTTALLNLGAARGALGDFAGQEREARRLLEIDSGSAAAWFNLGTARLGQDDAEGGATALHRSVELDPEFSRAHFYLSYIASRFGDRDEALARARMAVDLEPDNADFRNRLGAALASSGDPAGAGEAWRRALELDPDHAQAAENLRRLESRTLQQQ